jgi:mono/diheme cytochrome c family protein
MNLRSSFLSVLGLVGILSLSVGCDSDSKKAEPVKADADVKAAEPAKTEPVKTEPVNPEPTPTDIKAADTAAGDTKAADAAGGDTKPGDAAGDDTKAEDTKAEDTKAAGTKTAPKTETKKPADAKTADKTPAIDGKPLYDSKCKVCHGADGKGTEAMKKNNVPDMSDKAWQGKHSKAVVAKAIANGIDGSKMKPFKDKLKPEEIDAVAAYVKKLK